MKYDRYWDVLDIYTGAGFRQDSSGGNREASSRLRVGGTTACWGGKWYITRGS
jgi:hypothetical protein